jgi:hypothetical protein
VSAAGFIQFLLGSECLVAVATIFADCDEAGCYGESGEDFGAAASLAASTMIATMPSNLRII